MRPQQTMHLFKKKILAKLIIFLVLAVALITMGSVAYFNRTNASTIRAELEESMVSLREISRLSYALPLWYMSKMEIRYLNRALLANKHVMAINVYDDSSRFIASASRGLDGGHDTQENLEHPFLIPAGSEEIKKIYYTVIYGGLIVGSFDLFYTERFINEEINRRSINMAATFIVIGLATILVILVVVKKMLITPVLALADFSRQVTRNKDYSLAITTKSEDEIGTLYDSVTDMLREIRDHEGELQKTKGYLDGIIQSMPSMLVALDSEGTVTLWNQATETATGIAAGEILGRNLWESSTFLDGFEEAYREVLRTGRPIHLDRYRLETGETTFKNVSLYPLIGNEAMGAVIRIDDVTELEKKEQLLRQAQKMESIGTLASGIAHDFNNILGVILGTVSLIEYKMESGGEVGRAELQTHLGAIERSSRRAADMVKQLLALSRKKDVAFLPTDLNQVVRNVMAICRNTFDKVVELRATLAEGKAVVFGDALQMEQVLLNLCINAYHAMTMMKAEGEPMGGTIAVSLNKVWSDEHFVRHHPEASLNRSYWLLSVRDNGVGIPQSILPKIFDPFFTTKETGQGTGLGLAVAYGIIRQHSGFVDVYSSLNVGTTFNCYIPSIEEETMEGRATPEQPVIRGQGTILVVDHEPLMRDVARSILKEFGYATLVAEDGEEALSVFSERHRDIRMVLLDIIMPKRSGREVAAEMKKIDPNVRILFASGFSRDDRMDSGDSLEDVHFIQKPYTIKGLAEAIDRRLA